MSKWEYANVRVVIGGPLSGTKTEITFFHSDGHHEEKAGEFGKVMALLGDDGWEMVTSNARIDAGLGSKHIINYMFKRPKPAG